MNQYQQKGILVLVGISTILVSFSRSEPIEVAVFRGFGIIALVLSGLLFLFDRFLWKFWLFYDWLVPVPDLNGSWSGAGTEKITQVDADGTLRLVASELKAKRVEIDQQFSAIHLMIEWAEGGESRLKEPVPFSVSGRRTKVLTFGGVYDYERPGVPAEPRNVSVIATMDSRFFNNRPQTVRLTYATGARQGVIDLSGRQTPNKPLKPPSSTTRDHSHSDQSPDFDGRPISCPCGDDKREGGGAPRPRA